METDASPAERLINPPSDPYEQEILAIRQVYKKLRPVGPSAAQRVLRYVSSLFYEMATRAGQVDPPGSTQKPARPEEDFRHVTRD